MLVGDLPPGEAIRRLNNEGIVVQMGPFRLRIGSRISHFCRQFLDLYLNHKVEDPGLFIDFDLRMTARWSVTPPRGKVAIFEFNGEAPVVPLPIDQAMPLFEWGLNWCVTTLAHRFVMVHAGIVARGDEAILLPGASGSGKSTLTTALCYSGWRLFSDELALIDLDDRTAYPMPRPISLKNKSIASIQSFASGVHIGCIVNETRKGQIALLRPPAESIAVEERPARITRILFPFYNPAVEAVGIPMTPGQAFVKTFDSTFNYGIHGKRDFKLLADLVERAPSAEIHYSDLNAAVALIEGASFWPAPFLTT